MRCATRSFIAAATITSVVAATPLVAQDYSADKPPPAAPAVEIPLTPEEKTQLAAVDIRLAAVEALLPKIEDPSFKRSTLTAIADLKKRRAGLEKRFDPALYEALMHQVIGRYQVVALWLQPPRVPAPAESGQQKAQPDATSGDRS